MTILPVKKKREKEPSQQKPCSISGERSESTSSRAISSSSSSKRHRPQEDGAPPTKRSSGVMSPSGGHTESSPRSSTDDKKPGRHSASGGGDYNSDDEYELENFRDDSFQLEIDFANRLQARGLVIKEMVGDGACMFRAIAEQVYGDQEMHGQIRQLCMDYMTNNKDHFREFITENFENYIQRKRDPQVHGNHVELQAISEMFARPVEVYQYSDQPINVLLPRPEPAVPAAEGAAAASSSSSSTAAPAAPAPIIQQNAPLRLSYHRAVHYNAILAPNVATIGVGLGLPGMIPGAADKDLMNRAMATSELEHIEETMLQDKIDMTDYQRTQADIEDQITRESLLTYMTDMERNNSNRDSLSQEGPSTSSARPSSSSSSGPAESSSSVAPPAQPPVSSGSGLYEELLAAQSLVPEWDAYTDEVAVAEAMLLSQQEYMSNPPGPSNSGSDAPGTSGGSSSSS